MHAIVYYATRHGTTHRVASAIADGLRSSGAEVELRVIDDGIGAVDVAPSLVVVGGPTEGHGMTPAVAAFVEQLAASPLIDDAAVAAFDTRLAWPRWLSGSAAKQIAALLEGAIGRAVPSESFLVSTKPEITPEELERAERWGATLARLPVS